MGFFSWKCAKSGKPVMAEIGVKNTPWEFASDVVVLFKDGSRVVGSYDGYGRVIGDSYTELAELDENRWRMVIRRYYNNEQFEELSKNKSDPGQGWFYDDSDLEEMFSEYYGA